MSEPELLPSGVNEALQAGQLAAAGELLRSHSEAITRAQPGRGRAWSERLLSESPRWPQLRPWAEWAAATAFYLCGEADRAESLLASAVRAFRARRRGDIADRIGLILLDLYGERLQLSRARRLAARLVRRFRAAGDRQRLAATLANLGNAEDAADRITAAANLWRRALRDLDGQRALLVIGNLGNVAALEGRFDDALAAHRQVHEAAAAGGYESLAIQAQLNTADAEFTIGDVDAAFRHWHRAADRARTAGLPLFEAISQVELAQAELELGQVDAAHRRLQAAAGELEHLGLDLELARAWRLLAVAEAVQPEGDRTSAARARARLAGRRSLTAQRDLLEVDLAMLEREVDVGTVRRAARRLLRRGLRQRGLLGLAWCADRMVRAGDNRGALRLAREVLAHRRRSPWIDLTAHHVCARCLDNDPGAALRQARAAVRSAGRVHGRLRAAADRTAFLQARREVYLDLITRLVARGRAADLRQCLEMLSTLKAGWLVEELSRRADRGEDRTIRRWQALRRRLAALVELAQGEEEQRVRRVGVTVHRQLRRLEEELADVEVELGRVRPGLLPEPRRSTAAARLPLLLPAGHAYVEYLVETGDILAFVVWQGRLTVRRLRGAAAEVRRLTESIAFHQDTHTWMESKYRQQRQRSIRSRLRRLGRILLDAAPAGWSLLWVAPDELLYQVPWAALIDEEDRFLIDRGPVTLVPGGGVAAALLEGVHRRPSSSAFVGAGSGSLHLVEPEIRQLSAMQPGSVQRLHATRRDLIQALASHEAVHLAGHALYLDGAPGASGLRLEDGFVTIHDLAATSIRARLVSFGVCSGVRLRQAEASRFEGYLRVILASGARNVVGPTGWVLDTVARQFSVAFYTALWRTSHPASAFRQALLVLREDDPNPASWGAFQLFGDGRQWRAS